MLFNLISWISRTRLAGIFHDHTVQSRFGALLVLISLALPSYTVPSYSKNPVALATRRSRQTRPPWFSSYRRHWCFGYFTFIYLCSIYV